MNQFYQIRLEEAKQFHASGDISTFVLLKLYLKIKFAPGWKIEIDRNKVIDELGISVSQFRRALTRLRKEIKIAIKRVTRLCFDVPTEEETCAANAQNLRSKRAKPAQQTRKTCAANAQAEPQTTSKTSNHSDSPDLRSDLDQISLSDKPKPVAVNKVEQPKPKESLANKLDILPEGERQEFADFAWERVASLPERPGLPKQWIVKHFDDLLEDFRHLKKNNQPTAAAEQKKDKEFAAWYALMQKLGNVRGRRIEDGNYLVQRMTGEWRSVDDLINDGWTMEYLKKRTKK